MTMTTTYPDVKVYGEKSVKCDAGCGHRKLHVSHVELTAERDGLRKQFHTQAEQRDFVGRLVDNMPHAQIAAEFKEFKAEVADALTTMEHALRPDLFRPGFYEAAMEIIGVTREQLGIAPGKDGVNG